MYYVDRMPKLSAAPGFTLIELSIVLVIISLLLGGLLVGRDLIRHAELRAQINQVAMYNAAVYTFRSRFNGIPGDLPRPNRYGLPAVTCSLGWEMCGNGDGLVEANKPI